MKSQKEITLKEELDIRDRKDIYRNFLLYCMSGDVVALPMGTQVVGASLNFMLQLRAHMLKPSARCIVVNRRHKAGWSVLHVTAVHIA